jgi:hypothetical protein
VECRVVGPKFSLTSCLLTLVFQFPLPVPVTEKRQTGGTEPAHSEAVTPASGQSEAHPPSDDEVAEVKHEVSDQHVSMVQLHKYVPHCATLSIHSCSFTPPFLARWLH